MTTESAVENIGQASNETGLVIVICVIALAYVLGKLINAWSNRKRWELEALQLRAEPRNRSVQDELQEHADFHQRVTESMRAGRDGVEHQPRRES